MQAATADREKTERAKRKVLKSHFLANSHSFAFERLGLCVRRILLMAIETSEIPLTRCREDREQWMHLGLGGST